jgi:thioredoxin-related protein
MKRLLLGLVLTVAFSQRTAALEWLTDVPTAISRAKKENKAVLLDFTGSDWCGWCVKLKKEVFDQFEFAGYANSHLIMVEVDFPQRKSQSPEQMKDNANLAAKYSIKGYPTIILLNAEGERIGTTGYIPGGPKAFIAEISKFPGMPKPGSAGTTAATPPAPTPAAAKPQPAAAKPAPPPPAKVAAPDPATELRLKGVSGAANHRLALINNKTLMAGETAEIKTPKASLTVTVKEIRQNSVVIAVNGETRELWLSQR